MYRQELDVTLEGQHPTRIVTDQRDVAQLELAEWYGQPGKAINVLRHLAYTATRRTGVIPADTTWEEFNSRLCVHVDGVPTEEDEDEQGENPTNSTHGTRGISDAPSSISPSPVDNHW
jgi:hypothetical protein